MVFPTTLLEEIMPEKRTIKKAQTAKRQGKSPSTQAGAFVHEAIEHVRKGKHGARSAKQAIAIGLSEARRSGVAIADKSRKAETTKKASTPKSRIVAKKVSPTKSKAVVKRLESEPKSTVSHATLKAARTRTKHAR